MKIEQDNRRKQLIKLGVENIVDSLLNFSNISTEVDNFIDLLISSPKQAVLGYETKLLNLKEAYEFVDWRQVYRFAGELEIILHDLKASVIDPLEGVKRVACFYKEDSSLFEMCDDSDGTLSDVFCSSAKKIFVEFASVCQKKEEVVDILLELNQSDSYGVRACLIDCAVEYLPNHMIRKLINSFKESSINSNDTYTKRNFLSHIVSLAKQLKDIDLYKETKASLEGELSSSTIIELAEFHIDKEDYKTALSYLESLSDKSISIISTRDKMLAKIYKEQGDFQRLGELLFQEFRAHRLLDNFNSILEITGSDQRDKLIEEEVLMILNEKKLVLSNAIFLIEVDRIEEASCYLLDRSDQLEGGYYDSLLFIADIMESKRKYLLLSLIYRSLVSSVLERGYTKSYPHGIKYLKKLDKISDYIDDWGNYENHKEFKQRIRADYGLKYSFWRKYK